jgi:hypothetical protein
MRFGSLTCDCRSAAPGRRAGPEREGNRYNEAALTTPFTTMACCSTTVPCAPRSDEPSGRPQGTGALRTPGRDPEADCPAGRPADHLHPVAAGQVD